MGVCGSKPVAKEEEVVNMKKPETVDPVREPAKKPPSRIQESVAQNSGRQNVAVDFSGSNNNNSNNNNNTSQPLERKWSRQSSQKSQVCAGTWRTLPHKQWSNEIFVPLAASC